MKQNTYIRTALGLLVAGVLVGLFGYFVFDIAWLAAFGVAMVILSFIFISLGRTIPCISPEVSVLFLEAGITNLATMIEELGIQSRAVYLPASYNDGQAKALIPLRSEGSVVAISEALPKRLIVKYGDAPEDVGLLVATTGTTAVGMLQFKPGSALVEVEAALISLYRGILGVADGVVVHAKDGGLSVHVSNSQLKEKFTYIHKCLGSSLASIAAAVTAEALGKPMIITREIQNGSNDIVIEIEAIG